MLQFLNKSQSIIIPCSVGRSGICPDYSQQFAVWASAARVRARRARTLAAEARKQPAFGGLFSGWVPKWELLRTTPSNSLDGLQSREFSVFGCKLQQSRGLQPKSYL